MKPGYKQTEVGVIPNDWEVARLGEALTRLANGALYRPASDTGLPVTRIETIADGTIDMSRVGYGARTPELEEYRMRQGDILFSHINSVDHIGKVAFYGGQPPLFHGMNLLLLRAGNSLDCQFLFYWLGSHLGRKKAVSLARQAVSQASINTTDLKRVEISVPTLPEQRAIATALSDVDGLLGGLDRLIAKKRDLKQAAMQQLLTGKVRLPGYRGEWEVKRLGDLITHCFSGATPRRNRPEFYKGNIRWITSGELNYNVITDTLEKISSEAVAETNLAIHPAGTFLMAITGLEAEGTRGACGIVGAPSTTNQSCMAVFPTVALAGEYLFHYYVFRGKSLALQFCQGTKQQSYTASLVKQLPIDLPPTSLEQTAIAEVLADMDLELAGLEQRREKTRALKQAMMQELLTGKTRLV